MTDNKCVICGEDIRKNYKSSPTDKPSARIKCFSCIERGHKQGIAIALERIAKLEGQK